MIHLKQEGTERKWFNLVTLYLDKLLSIKKHIYYSDIFTPGLLTYIDVTSGNHPCYPSYFVRSLNRGVHGDNGARGSNRILMFQSFYFIKFDTEKT